MSEPTAPSRRRGLGRGLDALLGSIDLPSSDSGVLVDIPPSEIDPNPEQPRRSFDPEALASLAASLKTYGLLHPVVVERQGSRYRLIAGERRWRAATQAGLTTIPAILRPQSPSARDALEAALVENLARSDLNPLEEAAAYSRLADTFGMSHQAIALRLGKSRPAVSNAIRLLGLSAPVQEALESGRISAGHARALLGLSAPRDQERVLGQIISQDWNVRQTEAAVQHAGASPPAAATNSPATTTLAPDLEALRRGIEAVLGIPASLQRSGRGVRVVLHCASDQDLDELYRRLGGPPL